MGQRKRVGKHRFQQATALSWSCLGSSEHPVPVPAGVSQHDSGLLHLLPQWASAKERHCCSLCGFCLSAHPFYCLPNVSQAPHFQTGVYSASPSPTPAQTRVAGPPWSTAICPQVQDAVTNLQSPARQGKVSSAQQLGRPQKVSGLGCCGTWEQEVG